MAAQYLASDDDAGNNPLAGYPQRVRQILTATCAAHGVSVPVLLSKGATRRVFHARREAVARLRRLEWSDGLPPSFERIGSWLHRDHTSVIYALRSYAMRELEYGEVAAAYQVGTLPREFADD